MRRELQPTNSSLNSRQTDVSDIVWRLLDTPREHDEFAADLGKTILGICIQDATREGLNLPIEEMRSYLDQKSPSLR